jgi:hypothetical protein
MTGVSALFGARYSSAEQQAKYRGDAAAAENILDAETGAQTDPGELARAGMPGFEARPSPSLRPASIRYLTGLPPG